MTFELNVDINGQNNLDEAAKDVSQSVKKIEKDLGKFSKNVNGMFDSLKKNQLKFAAAFAGMSLAIKKTAGDFNEFEQVAKASQDRFGIAAEDILAKLKPVTQGLVSDTNIIKAANRSMALNVTSDLDQIGQLFEIARAKGAALGVDATQAFDDMVTGIGRNSPLILDNLGIITKGWAEQAEAQGVAMDATFIMNKILQDNADILEDNAGKVLTSKEQALAFSVAMENLSKNFGQISTRIQAMLLPVLTKLANSVQGLLDKYDNLTEGQKNLVAKIALAVVAFTGLLAVLPTIIGLVKTAGIVIAALTSPIGLVIAGVAALAFVFRDKLAKVVDVAKVAVSDVTRFFKLGADDQKKVLGIAAKGFVKIFIAMGKDLVGSFQKSLKNILTLIKNFAGIAVDLFSEIDWGKTFNGLLTAAKKAFTKVLSAAGDMAKKAFAKVKSIFSGKDTTDNAIAIELEKAKTGGSGDVFSKLTSGLDLNYFENTTAAIAEVGKELHTTINSAELAKGKIEEMGTETTTSTRALAQEIQNMNNKIKGGSGSGDTGATQKIAENLKKLGESYKEAAAKGKEEMGKLIVKHREASEKIKGKIEELTGALGDLETAYKKTMAGLDQSLGNAVTDQEDKIKKLKAELSASEDSGERSNLRAQLKEEEKALKDFLATSEGLEDEIAESRRRKALTEFERFVEDTEIKRTTEQEIFEQKKAQIKEEIEEQQIALEEENKIFQEKYAMYNEALNVHGDMVDGIIKGNGVMKDNMQQTVDQMKAKLAQLKSTLQEIKSLTAPKEGKDRRTLADVGRAFGAVDPTSNGVFTPINDGSSSGGVGGATTNNEYNINLQSSANSRNTVAQLLRQIELQQQYA